MAIFGSNPGSRTLNAASLRKLVGQQVSIKSGAITILEGEDQQFKVNDDGDLVISIVLDDGEVPMWCLAGALIGGANKGVWLIPDIDTEVMVGFPDGDFEGAPFIIAHLSSGTVPPNLTTGRMILVEDQIRLGSGNADTENFVLGQQLKAMLSTILSALITHIHPTPSGPSSPATPPEGGIGGTWDLEKTKVSNEDILSGKIFGEKS